MSNPQVKTLNQAQSLIEVQNGIRDVLEKYASPERPLCSHEILGLIDIQAFQAIARSIIPDAGGYSVPSSWIGSVAADMANQQRIRQTSRPCPYSKGCDAVWYL